MPDPAAPVSYDPAIDLPEAPPASEAPAVIHLPDRAQQPSARHPSAGRHTGRMKGRHFGPRPVDDPRSERIDLRVTPAQKAAINAAAADARLSVAAFICLRTLGSTGPRAGRSKPNPEVRNTARIMAALGRCGSNLNQLFGKASAYDFRGIPILLDMAETMKAAHAAHHELVAAIMAKLDGRKRRSQRGPDTDTAARIVADLNRSGNDLNSLLQKVNAYDFRGVPEWLDMCAEMKAAHAAHHRLVVAIKAELGI